MQFIKGGLAFRAARELGFEVQEAIRPLSQQKRLACCGEPLA
jgi:hypothetical protein